MSGTEKIVALIKDVLLPIDSATRYDIYFTDRRIAIVCMGRSDRYEHGRGYSSLNFIAPTTATVDHERKERIDRTVLEDEVAQLSMDDKLRLSKKSCYYTYDEIEEVRLVLGEHQSKLVILSADCESKFVPNQDQLKQLKDLLPKIDALKGKLSEAGSWRILHETDETEDVICGSCGFENDADAVFCQSCGKKIDEEAVPPPERVCGACGTKNRSPTAFCKNCGTAIQTNVGNTS